MTLLLTMAGTELNAPSVGGARPLVNNHPIMSVIGRGLVSLYVSLLWLHFIGMI